MRLYRESVQQVLADLRCWGWLYAHPCEDAKTVSACDSKQGLDAWKQDYVHSVEA